ncbi:Transmembrane and coiled-coil domain-containing protein 4 [Dinochytrium kinnereticum]|nr:Transmembrane and coiled-coil domain-containing protein 4 [Dinochytrium kinnereticum]
MADVELFGSELSLDAAVDSFRKTMANEIAEKPRPEIADELDSMLSSILSSILNASMMHSAALKRELRYDARLRQLIRKIIQNTIPLVEEQSGLLGYSEKSQSEALKSLSLMLHNVEATIAIQLVSQVESADKDKDESSAGKASAALAEADKQHTGDFDHQVKKWMTIGLATVGGGVVIGVTGGLAAPLIGAGMGTFLARVTGTATMVGIMGSSAGAAVIGTLFGITGGGVAAFKFKKRLQGLEECYFKTITSQESSIHAIICISGWLESLDDATEPWQAISSFAPFSEIDAMVFDSDHLIALGTSIRDFLGSTAASYATTEVLKHTILGGLVLALVWPVGLLNLSYLVDNPWSIGLDRSRKAGELLGKEVLLPQIQGKRPLTLVGWGLGARTIFYALLELAIAGDNGNQSVYGMVDSVYLFGAPIEGDPELWTRATSVVSGRFVNGYSSNDWFLYFLYRAGSPNDRVAGLHPMVTMADAGATSWFGWNKPTTLPTRQESWVRSRIENFELSSIVSSHAKYKDALPDILEFVGFERVLPAVKKPMAPSAPPIESTHDLAGVDPEEKRMQILQLMPRKSSLAHTLPTSMVAAPAPSVVTTSVRPRLSSRNIEKQELSIKEATSAPNTRLEQESSASNDKKLLSLEVSRGGRPITPEPPTIKPPPILVIAEPTPVSIDTLFDSDIESGEKVIGDLGTDTSNFEILDVLSQNEDMDFKSHVYSSNLSLSSQGVTPGGRRKSPVEAVFEPNALAVDPLSRGPSSNSLGEDEADRKEADSWVGAGIDERVYLGPVAEMVKTPLSSLPQ